MRRRFFDVFADDGAEVNAVEVELQGLGEDASGHRFAGAADAGEEGADAEAATAPLGKAPVVVDLRSLLHVGDDLLQQLLLGVGQDQIVPSFLRVQPLGQIVQLGPRLQAAGRPEGREVGGGSFRVRCLGLGLQTSRLNLVGGEVELIGQGLDEAIGVAVVAFAAVAFAAGDCAVRRCVGWD